MYEICSKQAIKTPEQRSGTFNVTFEYTAFTRKSAYARKSAFLELAPPFWREIFNEHLPRMSAPLFSQKRRSFEK